MDVVPIRVQSNRTRAIFEALTTLGKDALHRSLRLDEPQFDRGIVYVFIYSRQMFRIDALNRVSADVDHSILVAHVPKCADVSINRLY